MKPFARRVGAKPMQGFRKLIDVPITTESNNVDTLARLTAEFDRRGVLYRVHGHARDKFAWRVWVHARHLPIARRIVADLMARAIVGKEATS